MKCLPDHTRLLPAIAGSMFLMCSGSGLNGTEVFTEGTLRWEAYDRIQGGLVSAKAASAVIHISGGDVWNIKLDYKNGAVHEFGCDGTNVYSILFGISANPEKSNAMPALINAGVYPRDSSVQPRFLWLGLASANYLKRDPHSLPAIWLDQRNDPAAYMFRSTVEAFDQPPFLPKLVTFTVDEKLREKAASNPNLASNAKAEIGQRKQLMENFPTGFVGATMISRGFTNVASAGVWIPTEIEFLRSVPAGEEEKLFERFEWTMASAFVTNVASFLPVPTNELSVADYRLNDPNFGVDLIHYKLEPSAGWPTEVSSDHLAALELEKLGRVAPGGQQPLAVRVAVLILFIFVAGLSALFFLQKWRKSRAIQQPN